MDDFDLLQAYASCRTEDAFTVLTARYVNLVYSAALRQTGDAQAAEDITQAVFLTLARKAGSISHDTILSGWLLRTTRFAAANARRLEQRRHHYEQQAMQSYADFTEPDVTWTRIAPLLDGAIDRLSAKDRDAIVLRFFEGKSLKLVAEKLGVSEDGAQKRVSRALEKLRNYFGRQGKNVSSALLAGALAANAVQAAPATLAASVCAVVASGSILTGSAVAALARATVDAIERARLIAVGVRIGTVAALLGLAVIAVVGIYKSDTDTSIPAAAAPTGSRVPGRPASGLEVSASALQAAGPRQPDGRRLLLRVLDSQAGAPVTNARLTLVSVADSSGRTTNMFVTDAEGASAISYAPVRVKTWSHRIEVFRDGYVPKFVSWSEYQQDRFEEIPDEYTVKLDPAVTIGGVVVDEQDTPVSGLRVVFSVSGPIASRSRERLTMMGDYHTEVTDALGHWSCDHVPPRFGMIDYKLVDPRFQEKTCAADSPDSPAYANVDRVPAAALLAGRAVMRVKPGLAIAGRVTDENGGPVAGAKVTQGFDFNRLERNIITEVDGSFRFRNGRPHELSLTVQAAGLAPVVTSFVMNASVEDLRFTLPGGRTLRGRVVDETGQPIAGATVEAASPSADSRTLFEWRTRTDAGGNFTWDTAPEHQEYAIYASGYDPESRFTLKADATEQLVQLKKKASSAVRILGQVVDAETKSPPPSVRVQIWETTKEPGGGLSSFTTRPEDAGVDGKFRLKTSSGTLSYAIEAQADGYWPERLTNQVTGESEVHVKIELKKAPLFAGVVLAPAGEPASSATLVVCGPQEWVQMNQAGKFHLDSHSSVVSTMADAQGRFQLPPKYAPEVVVVAHAQGFAQVPFSQVSSHTSIALQPWGRIEGTAQLRGKPVAGDTIRLGAMHWRFSPRVSLYISATTDADGRFAFESVPPGEWKVERETNPRPHEMRGLHFPARSHGVPVVVPTGETARVALGGTGRPVIGKVVAPDAKAAMAWTENSVTLALKIPAPDQPKASARGSYDSDQAYAAALKSFVEQSQAYWNSEQGQAVLRLQRQYRALFEPGGTFRIDDVPSGDYTLSIHLTEPPKGSSQIFLNSAIIASLNMDVTVPAMSADREDAPLDLGLLQLNPAPAQRSSR